MILDGCASLSVCFVLLDVERWLYLPMNSLKEMTGVDDPREKTAIDQ